MVGFLNGVSLRRIPTCCSFVCLFVRSLVRSFVCLLSVVVVAAMVVVGGGGGVVLVVVVWAMAPV
jgi:hypothetical protein